MPATFTVKFSPQLQDWRGTLSRALARGGEGFTMELKNYPPARHMPWDRRGRGIANFSRANVEGLTMQLGGPPQLRYMLFGTGMFGPLHHMITPTSAKVLAWPVTGAKQIGMAGIKTSAFGVSYGAQGGNLPSRNVGFMFARSTKGSIWPGKLVQVKAATVRGFEVGLKAELGQ
jgi:hypothetical protein